MKKFVKIIEPNQEIIDTQKIVVKKLKSIFPKVQVEAVGSMVVPMIGRSEIDIMIIANKSDISSFVDRLISEKYTRGPVVGGIAYIRKFEGEIEIGIQILPINHTMIDVHRKIIRKLRSDEKLRNDYSQFKKTLNGLLEDDYKKQKSEWIMKNILK